MPKKRAFKPKMKGPMRHRKPIQGIGQYVDPKLQFNIPVEVERDKKVTHKEVFGKGQPKSHSMKTRSKK